MTKHARNIAHSFRVMLPDVRKLGCPHGVAVWAALTGSVFAALHEDGHLVAGESAEWLALCGIPPQASEPDSAPKVRPS